MFSCNLEQDRFLLSESELEVRRSGATVHKILIVFVGGYESVLALPGMGETGKQKNAWSVSVS